MREEGVDQDRRPVSRRGVLGFGFAGTLGLPAVGRAMQAMPVSGHMEQRILESVTWAMCVDEALFNEIKVGDFHSVEAHYHLTPEGRRLLQEICLEGHTHIASLRTALESERAALEWLGGKYEEHDRLPCPIFPCPWWRESA
jgi:hypothetical protein